MTAPELAGFVRRQLGDAESTYGKDLSLSTIKDVRALQVLMALASASSLKSSKIDQASLAMTRGFRVRQIVGEPLITPFLTGTSFRIERLRRQTAEESASK